MANGYVTCQASTEIAVIFRRNIEINGVFRAFTLPFTAFAL